MTVEEKDAMRRQKDLEWSIPLERMTEAVMELASWHHQDLGKQPRAADVATEVNILDNANPDAVAAAIADLPLTTVTLALNVLASIISGQMVEQTVALWRKGAE